MVLTNTAVRHAKPRAKSYTLPDFDGLALFVNTKGTKSWHFRFSWAGKQPRISFGTYPEIGLRDARVLRDIARALIAKGIDPRDQRRLMCDATDPFLGVGREKSVSGAVREQWCCDQKCEPGGVTSCVQRSARTVI